MNSKERVALAFAHREADRVPIFELTIDNPTAERVLGRRSLGGFGGWSRGLMQNRALIAGRFAEYWQQRTTDEIELYRALDLDVYPGPGPQPVASLAPEQIGEHEWRFEDRASGWWSVCRYAPSSDTYDEVDSSLRAGGLPALARLTEALEAAPLDLDAWDFTQIDRILAELGAERCVMTHADVEIGSTYCWAETFLVGMVEAPDLIGRYLDARLRHQLFLLEALLERGVAGVEGGYDWAAAKGPLFSPRHFRKFVFPRLKRITDLCHRFGVPFVKHTDGNINSLLDDLVAAGVDAFQAIEPRAGMDLAQLKRDYGDRLTLIGNVDCSTVLVDGPVEAVRAQTEWVIRTAGPGGGFLLSTSNSVHPGVVPEYYFVMLETARAVGQYPIR